MTRSMTFLLGATLLLALAACGNDDADAKPGDTCSYGGEVYQKGDVFCATDGCNSCSCTTQGVGCTLKDCSAADQVPSVCQQGSDTCSYDGKVYQTGDVFCSTDGCNSCSCNPEGTRGVGCSAKDCSAPGVIGAAVCQGD